MDELYAILMIEKQFVKCVKLNYFFYRSEYEITSVHLDMIMNESLGKDYPYKVAELNPLLNTCTYMLLTCQCSDTSIII